MILAAVHSAAQHSVPGLVVIYIAILLAETTLHPYDVVECEPELVSGYYVDHGGIAFMLIYLAEGICLH